MIYDFPQAADPIRQGDIFFPLPFVGIDLENIPVVKEDGTSEIKKWEDVVAPQPAALSIDKSWGIVASQDCDNVRSPNVTFFVIKPFVESIRTPPKDTQNWVSWITRKSKENAKLFYLPEDNKLGFSDRMVVLFENVIQVQRESLESRKLSLRKGRLNNVADEHFRESIAQFFRRYPYNEWYPLNPEEFKHYSDKAGEAIPPYSWQKPEAD